jgi:hypothetical protein
MLNVDPASWALGPVTEAHAPQSWEPSDSNWAASAAWFPQLLALSASDTVGHHLCPLGFAFGSTNNRSIFAIKRHPQLNSHPRWLWFLADMLVLCASNRPTSDWTLTAPRSARLT